MLIVIKQNRQQERMVIPCTWFGLNFEEQKYVLTY